MVANIIDTREEQAKREIGVTDVSRGVAWMLTIAYLAITFGVAAVEYGRAVVVRQRGGNPTARFHAAWHGLGPALARPGVPPTARSAGRWVRTPS